MLPYLGFGKNFAFVLGTSHDWLVLGIGRFEEKVVEIHSSTTEYRSSSLNNGWEIQQKKFKHLSVSTKIYSN